MNIYQMAGYDVEVIRKPIRHIYLRVLPPDGALRITAPKYVTQKALVAFFESKVAWVEKQREKLARKVPYTAPRWENGGQITLFDTPYTIVFQEVKKSPKIKILEETLVVEIKAGESEQDREKRLRAFCQNMLLDEVERQFVSLKELMGIAPSSYYIREMKTRWGTCNTKTGRICINLRLLYAPRECLRYVLIHELCHLWVPNHGPAFYEKLSNYCPDHKRLRARLGGITSHHLGEPN